jgi:cytochrome c2
MKHCFYLWILVAILGCSSPVEQNAITEKLATLPSNSWSLDLTEIIPLEIEKQQPLFVHDDPYFKKNKHYQVISLRYLLQKYLLLHNNMDTTSALLVFECVDGYKPTIPLQLALEQDGFIAIKDEEAELNQYWTNEVKDKFTPYYLVWTSSSSNLLIEKELAWPYGLYKISLSYFSEEYAAVFPKEHPEFVEGFNLFKSNCMKCHSINKVGGNLGPELNYPKNITEYWDKEDIWQFIQSPQSYRYNSKMPSMDKLARTDFEAIIGYISHMKNEKIK